MHHAVHHMHERCLGNRTLHISQQPTCPQTIQSIVATTESASADTQAWSVELQYEIREGGSAQSAELACRLAAAASLSSCIISRAVTVLLASEAREFFWALDNLSFVCIQYEVSDVNSRLSDRLPNRWPAI